MVKGGIPKNFNIIFVLFLILSLSACQTLDSNKNVDMQMALNKANNERLFTKPIRLGDTIAIKYIGYFDNGTVFSRSPKGKALKLVIGESKLLDGFENALIGMKLNEEKSFNIAPEEAYGKYNVHLKKSISLASIPKNIKTQIGAVIKASDATGKQLTGVIIALDDKVATVDFNHPLAGKKLNFKVKILAIKKIN